ncbi:MAG: M48 family metallopeptidase [Patescibacteria group bacterium]|jgi:hypothetical protein
MQRSIELQTKQINYTLKKNPRSRHLRLVVRCDGLVATMPHWMGEDVAESFIRQKADWILEKLALVKTRAVVQNSRRDYLAKKEIARELIAKKLDYFNIHYNFTFTRVAIRNTKTRWGSCSRSGNLNFNYKILYLPEHLFDYIVVHELCHLEQLNHSPKFWRLVAEAIPGYKAARRELRKTWSHY